MAHRSEMQLPVPPVRLSSWVRSGAAACAVLAWGAMPFAAGCGSGGGSGATIVVNSLADPAIPAAGVTTLRSALAAARAHDTIVFDPALDGKAVETLIVGAAHSVLKGEVYSGMTFGGYQDRDYGKSALYAAHDVSIDASGLTRGITVEWTGGDANRARVLAVYGNLTMNNVTIRSGHSSAEAVAGGTQPYTLARGGGLAVWGVARLAHCTVNGNRCTGDNESSRDRGTYGAGIYANGLDLQDCVISGNSAIGYGAAGGGIYSVGGADNQGGKGNDTTLARCTVSGNRVTAQHAYGGGVFTLSGGPNNRATMWLTNCTIARNLAEDNPALPEVGQYYDRGGGIYMGGGSLSVVSCTIAENEVNGHMAMFSGSPNMGGGGVAATIGSAHTVEDVVVQHSIVAGNKLNGVANDWFTGSLLTFASHGYNLVGVIDFSRILVPVPEWMYLSRKHYPKVGDQSNVSVLQALGAAHLHASIVSAGTDSGQPAVLWYAPGELAASKVPTRKYTVTFVNAGYTGYGTSTDDFLNAVVLKLRADYAAVLGSDFGSSFGDMAGVSWYGPAETWPSNAANQTWITFWRNLDTNIGDKLGMVTLGDDFWATFTSGPVGSHVDLRVETHDDSCTMTRTDQLGAQRGAAQMGSIGAIER